MSALSKIRRVLANVKDMGDGFTALCPAHDDSANSLKVDPKDDSEDGWPLLRCYTGCTFDAIKAVLVARGVKIEARPKDRSSTTEKRWEIRDADGKLIATKIRIDPGKKIWWERPDGERGLRGYANTEDLLYRVEVLAKNPEKPVVITEGEKACDALVKLGVTCALGTVGGANSSLSTKVLQALKGRLVYLWPDNDEAGAKHMDSIKAKLIGIAERVSTIRWPDAPPKGDAADFKGTIADFGELAADSLLQPTPAWSKPFMQALVAWGRDLDRRVAGDVNRFVSSGIQMFDDEIDGGFKPGEVYLFGAPTGGGKTTLMLNVAMNAARGSALRPSVRVLFVTPEMTLTEIGKRAVVQAIETPVREVWRNPALGERFAVAAANLVRLPIQLVDRVDIGMDEIALEAQRLAGEDDGLGLVVIDYAQQVVDDGDGRRPRYLAVGDVAERAVTIAQALNVPVLIASQVNVSREEGRNDTVKRGYTFRESAKLEHKASVVLIFDRRRDLNPDSEQQAPEGDTVEMKLMCFKNRLGPQFKTIELLWDKPLYRVRSGPWPSKFADETPEDFRVVGPGAPVGGVSDTLFEMNGD